MFDLRKAWKHWTPDLLNRAMKAFMELDDEIAVSTFLYDPVVRKHPHYEELKVNLRKQLMRQTKRRAKYLAVILEFQLHQDMCQKVGKLKRLAIRPNGEIYDRETGEILSVIKYPPEEWTKERYEREGWETWLPHKALGGVDIPPGVHGVLEHKLDGVSTRCAIMSYGLRFFGPRIVKNGWVGEYSDKVIHLRDLRLPYRGTVLDGEFVHPCGIMPDRKAAGILNPNTKPETSWEKQVKEGWLIYVAYDVLYYRGVNVMNLPYAKRLELLQKVMIDKNTGLPHHECFLPIYVVPENGATIDGVWFSQKSYHQYILDHNMEGTIWCDLSAPYECGARNKAKIKFKKIDTFDVIIMGYEPPEREVDFSVAKTSPKDWKYWVDENDNPLPEGSHYKRKGAIAVTKYYWHGWIGSIVFGVYNEKGELVEVGRCSGMDEDVRRLLSSKKRKNMFKGNRKAIGSVIEVQGQLYDTENSIRWPQFVRFRTDKNPQDCTLKALKLSSGGSKNG